MSYILDALKKSEQARLQGLGTERYPLLPASAGATLPQRFWMPALLAGLIAVNAFLLYPRLPAAPQVQMAAADTTAPPRRTAGRMADVTAPLPASRPPVAAAPPPPPRNARREAQAKPIPAAKKSRPEIPLEVAASAAPPNDGAPPAAAPKPLPPLAVTGYIRSADGDNMVIVNDKLLREGEEFEPGLKLEQILGDGVVFNYKGYRFKR